MRANIGKFNITNFKGYDACPIKNLYMEGVYDNERKQVYRELKDIAKKEGIELFYDDGLSKISSDDNPRSVSFATRWIQDNKAIILRNGQKTLISKPNSRSVNYALTRHLNSDFVESSSFATGGNMFIGKKPNGEKWVLIGQDSFKRELNSLEKFCKDYDIKPENVHVLTQPNYHLDMAIRPIGYPFILVNDELLAKKNTSDDLILKNAVYDYYDELKNKHPYSTNPYASCDKTVEELKEAGFMPIRIGGAYTDQINYMNAIVNEHPDGTISYITNSAEGSAFSKLDKIFEQELNEIAPGIKKTYFISGGKPETGLYSNVMMEHLGALHGGIHCMTLEEPNFERWG